MTIALFTLGGTIAMAGRRRDANGGPVVARLTGADLTEAVPGLADLGVPLDIHDIDAVPSANLTFGQVLDLVAAASRAVSAGARGVMVTQGTDTLEETAYLVDLVWPHDEPFVLTGAMRNPTLAGPDGPANVLAAARVAAADVTRGLGALVAFNDEIHAPRWVRKTHSTSTATFASPNTGPIGHVIEGRVRLLSTPARRPVLPMPTESPDGQRVAVYPLSLGDDPELLLSFADSLAGLVVAAFGVGHVPAAFAEPLGELAQRIPVVLGSRTGGGSVLRNTYGAIGAEADLRRRGLIGAGLLDQYKARVLLKLLLANGIDRSGIERAFAEHG